MLACHGEEMLLIGKCLFAGGFNKESPIVEGAAGVSDKGTGYGYVVPG